MKKLLVLAAVMYVLPKTQPIYPGMIVRCDQLGTREFVIVGNPQPPESCPGLKCQCHWECEYGLTTATYIENGNQKTRDKGCASATGKPSFIYQDNVMPIDGGMFSPVHISL